MRLAGELAAVTRDRVGARRRRRSRECRLPPSRTSGRPRRHGVRVRDTRHGGRRCADERRRVRARLVGDRPARARRRSCGSDLEVEHRPRPRHIGTRRSREGRSWPRSSSSSSLAREVEIRRTVAELNATRKATQPTNKRTFGSVFKNPAHELGAGKMLDECGLQGLSNRRRSDLAAARKLHRERRELQRRRTPSA